MNERIAAMTEERFFNTQRHLASTPNTNSGNFSSYKCRIVSITKIFTILLVTLNLPIHGWFLIRMVFIPKNYKIRMSYYIKLLFYL